MNIKRFFRLRFIGAYIPKIRNELRILLQKCSDTRVSDKRVFYTFARTLPPSSKVSKSVVALLRAFDWHRFVVVSGEHPASGREVKEAIEVRFNSYVLECDSKKIFFLENIDL